jgi:hypothetical protein
MDNGMEKSGHRHSVSSRFAASDKQDMEIDIVTAEGDKVTLSSSTLSQVSYESYDRWGRRGGGSYRESGESLTLESSASYSFTVEGDLSEEELADINALLGEIDGIMGDFLEGDMASVVDKALNMGTFDSISQFEAELRVEKYVMTEQKRVGRPAWSMPERRAQEAESLQPEDPAIEAVRNLVDGMMESVEEVEVEPEKVRGPVSELFDRFIEGFSDEEDAEMDITRLIRSQLLGRIDSLIPAESEEAASPLQDD